MTATCDGDGYVSLDPAAHVPLQQLLDSSDGEDGWDIFALTYKVDAPISAVITPACMKRYMRIFNFLWQLKRVEYSLNATWCRHMTAAHVLEVSQSTPLVLVASPFLTVQPVLCVQAIPVLRGAFHRCHLLRTEMVHLVSTLANYVMFEVRLLSHCHTFVTCQLM